MIASALNILAVLRDERGATKGPFHKKGFIMNDTLKVPLWPRKTARIFNAPAA